MFALDAGRGGWHRDYGEGDLPMVGMTDKEIEEAEQIARRYGPANCWTGTSGMMAEWILKLVQELKRRRDAERREVSSEEV